MKKYFAIIALLTVSFNINAATLQDSQLQTVTGQNFTHNLNGPASNGSGGVLTVTTRGDFYEGGQFNESYDVSIDGITLGAGISFDTTGAYDVTTTTFNDHTFSMNFLLSGAQMSLIMQDLLAVVLVDFGSGMNVFNAAFGSTVSLNYNSVSAVPVPAALFMLAPALLGFFGFRRNMQA
ncbi:MAG: hypothetical protein KBT88_16025 [Gammaproteobacteria bacterium]|nr:hypothetical protein [Gammaproteobacteria bacterium]